MAEADTIEIKVRLAGRVLQRAVCNINDRKALRRLFYSLKGVGIDLKEIMEKEEWFDSEGTWFEE